MPVVPIDHLVPLRTTMFDSRYSVAGEEAVPLGRKSQGINGPGRVVCREGEDEAKRHVDKR